MSSDIPGLPIAPAELRALFDFLDRPNPKPCNHTFQVTIGFLESRHLPVKPMLTWLGENGAGCDCEVIFNTDAQWGEAVGRVSSDDDF